jgi:hypothetical protein
MRNARVVRIGRGDGEMAIDVGCASACVAKRQVAHGARIADVQRKVGIDNWGNVGDNESIDQQRVGEREQHRRLAAHRVAEHGGARHGWQCACK